MIRWSYLLPRLAIALAVMLAVHFGVPPLVRWALVGSVRATTGADVEVATVWTSLPRGELRLVDVQLARDRSSTTNLMQFDSAQLSLDLGALAHKRCVVNQARIHGLRFNQPRHARALDEAEPDSDESQPARDGSQTSREHMRRWLRDAAAVLEYRAEEEFESVRLAQQLAKRWPEDYRQLQQQAQQIRQQAVELHQLFSRLNEQRSAINQASELQRRWSEVLQLREDIASLQRRAAQLAQQMDQDRNAIRTALTRDRDHLQEEMQLAQLNAQQLSEFLLDGEMRHWWTQLKPWLDLARWLTDSPESNDLGDRGVVVQYETDAPQPDYLIRYAHLDGQLTLAGHQVSFLGQARDLTLPGKLGAARLDRPTRLNFVTQGPFTAQLYTQLDRADGAPRQLFALRCDDLPVPGRRWGSEDSLNVSVKPTKVQIQGRVIAAQGKLDGCLRVTQRGMQLTATGPRKSVPSLLLEPLNESVGTIRHIDLWVDISGAVTAPNCQLRSDLGTQLQQHLQAAARELVRHQTDQLVAEADQQLSAALADLQQEVLAEETMLQQQIGAANTVLSSLAEPVTAHLKPLGDLLQRF